MTQSKRTGAWGTPREHRRESLKFIREQAKASSIKKHVKNIKVTPSGVLRGISKALGPLSIVPMITGVLRARSELKKAGIKDPSTLETFSQMYIPKSGFQIKQYKERKKLAEAI